MNLKTSYLGLELESPIVVGSSGLTLSLNNIKKFAGYGAGAIVLKSLFEEQIMFETKNSLESYDTYQHPEALDYLKSIARDQSIMNYLDLIQEAKKAVSVPIIASINCVSDNKWTEFAGDLENAGADALELNIFITDFQKLNSSQIEDLYIKIIEDVKGNTGLPIAIKVSYFFTNLPRVLLKLGYTGVNGLVLFNRYYSPDIDIENLKVTSGSYFSSPDEVIVPLRWIGMIADSVSCDISATTGVHTAVEAIKLFMVGATTVQICSTLYKNGIDYLKNIVQDLANWMKDHNYNSIDQIRGILKSKSTEEQKLFSRTQYMRHYSKQE
ncbi:MAG: dihydroorotate dehydrogenase-like protein [Bacteroidales bacterium]|nr:MAG: dihydroorotate dehydrogenase-like protein [Bacteroidales bacterium]